jgi:hypothetical protein
MRELEEMDALAEAEEGHADDGKRDDSADHHKTMFSAGELLILSPEGWGRPHTTGKLMRRPNSDCN